MNVGDIVLYNHGHHETVMVSDQPLAALVTYLHHHEKTGDVSSVNLAVFGKNGDQWQKHGVKLWDGNDEPPEARFAFAYPAEVNLAQRYKDNLPAENDGEPADADSDVVHPSTRGPNNPNWGRVSDGPYPPGHAYNKPNPPGALQFGMPAGGLVNPPVGPEYNPDSPNPAPGAPEEINKVPADSPANPDRPLD